MSRLDNVTYTKERTMYWKTSSEDIVRQWASTKAMDALEHKAEQKMDYGDKRRQGTDLYLKDIDLSKYGIDISQYGRGNEGVEDVSIVFWDVEHKKDNTYTPVFKITYFKGRPVIEKTSRAAEVRVRDGGVTTSADAVAHAVVRDAIEIVDKRQANTSHQSSLQKQLIRLGDERPDLQNHLRPVLDHLSTKTAMDQNEQEQVVRRSTDEMQEASELMDSAFNKLNRIELLPEPDRLVVEVAELRDQIQELSRKIKNNRYL